MEKESLLKKIQEIKDLAFNSIKYAKKKNFIEAERLLEKAKEISVGAFELESNILSYENDLDINFLNVYLKGTLMNAILIRDFAEELVEVYKRYLY